MRFMNLSIAAVAIAATLLTGCGNSDRGYNNQDYYGDSSYGAPRIVVVRYRNGRAQYYTINQNYGQLSPHQMEMYANQNAQWLPMNGDRAINGDYPTNPGDGMYFVENPGDQYVDDSGDYEETDYRPDMSEGRDFESGGSGYGVSYAYSCTQTYGYYHYRNYCHNSTWYHMYPRYRRGWSWRSYAWQPTYFWPRGGRQWRTGYYYYRPHHYWTWGGWTYNWYVAWWY